MLFVERRHSAYRQNKPEVYQLAQYRRLPCRIGMALRTQKNSGG